MTAQEDQRIDTEYGYLLMRKAIESPANPRASEWIESGTQLLEGSSPHEDAPTITHFTSSGAKGLPGQGEHREAMMKSGACLRTA